MTATADEAHERGNSLYKQGKLYGAKTAYIEASRLAPADARPLSNLSSVLFELAQGAESTEAGHKALVILGEENQESLSERVRVRLVKSHVLAKEYEEAQDVLSKVKTEETQRTLQPSLSRISTLPNSKPEQRSIRKQLIDNIAYYRPALVVEPEYYSVGHDDANILMAQNLLDPSPNDISCFA